MHNALEETWVRWKLSKLFAVSPKIHPAYPHNPPRLVITLLYLGVCFGFVDLSKTLFAFAAETFQFNGFSMALSIGVGSALTVWLLCWPYGLGLHAGSLGWLRGKGRGCFLSSVGLGLLLVAPVLLMSMLFGLLVHDSFGFPTLSGQPSYQTLFRGLGRLFSGDFTLVQPPVSDVLLMTTAVFGAPAEELLFRRFAIRALMPYMSLWWAVLLSSGLFGLGHCFEGFGKFPDTFVAGLVFSAVYLRTGSICTSSVLHAGLNLAGAVLAVLALS